MERQETGDKNYILAVVRFPSIRRLRLDRSSPRGAKAHRPPWLLVATATRNHGLAACGSAIRSDEPMPPNARLWLARASLFTDDKGRTRYGPARYATDCRDTEQSGEAGIAWLCARGLVCNDHDDNGIECWRLLHYDWDQPEPRINGYSTNAGQKRDGLPPQYGRTVDDVIDPPTGRQDFTPPTWADIAPTIKEAHA